MMKPKDQMILRLLTHGRIRVQLDSGLVFSKNKKGSIGTINYTGYLVSPLRLNGETFNIRIHRVVYIAAHGFIPSGLQINHINGIKADNRIGNLEAITQTENMQHASRLNLLGGENSVSKRPHRRKQMSEFARSRFRDSKGRFIKFISMNER